MSAPEARYAESHGSTVAWACYGNGPIDVMWVPGWVSHVELNWELPCFRRFAERVAAFGRLIWLDKRGTGLSDRVEGVPTLEDRVGDVAAVLDAAGSTRAVVAGQSEGGQTAIMFAAARPDITHSLILWATAAGYDKTDMFEPFLARVHREWGEGAMLPIAWATAPRDEVTTRLLARFERYSATPKEALAILERTLVSDVRPLLPHIAVPTLVIHHEGDRFIPFKYGRELADAIPGAQFAPTPGRFHIGWTADEVDTSMDPFEEFVTGERRHLPTERVLATVLFADIVGSTERAAELGDRRWREVLDGDQPLVRGQIRDYRGREVNTRGDDFLVTFDGPARAIRCARAIQGEARAFGLEVRAGIHTGEVEVRDGDLAGIAVHIGARVAALADPGEVVVTSTVRDLVVGSGLEFDDRGEHQLKGVPGAWRLLAVSA